MSRKYRQHGYQDDDRERKPKPPPRPKGAGARIETRFHLITRCNNCAAEIQINDKIEADGSLQELRDGSAHLPELPEL